jgi:hypothetical protein
MHVLRLFSCNGLLIPSRIGGGCGSEKHVTGSEKFQTIPGLHWSPLPWPVLAVAAATAPAAVEHQSGEAAAAAAAPAMAAFPALRSADMPGWTSVPRFRSEQEEQNANGNHASSPSMLVFSGISSAFALINPFVVVTDKKVPLYIGITSHIVVMEFDSSVVVKENWQLQ